MARSALRDDPERMRLPSPGLGLGGARRRRPHCPPQPLPRGRIPGAGNPRAVRHRRAAAPSRTPPSPSLQLAGDEPEPLLHFLLPPDELEPRAEEAIPGGVRWYLDRARRPGRRGGVPAPLRRRAATSWSSSSPASSTRSSARPARCSSPAAPAAARPRSPSTAWPPPGNRRRPRRSTSPTAPPWSSTPARSTTTWPLARGADPDRHPPDFFTFGDLYRSLMPRELREHQSRPMTEAALPRVVPACRAASLDPALVWEELRSILKGACLSLSPAHARRGRLLRAGKKARAALRGRAAGDLPHRPALPGVARRGGAVRPHRPLPPRFRGAAPEPARQDLGRGGLRRGPGPDRAGSGLRPRPVAPAGPVAASCSPATRSRSSTRAASAGPRRAAWPAAPPTGRRRPAVLRLRRNLRSVRPLVELANAAPPAAPRGLRPHRGGRARGGRRSRVRCRSRSAPPRRRCSRAIAGFGPRCAVLTLDDDEAERLRARLGTEPGLPRARGQGAGVRDRRALEAARPGPRPRRTASCGGRQPAGTGAPLPAPPPAPLRGGDPRPPSPGHLRGAGAASFWGDRRFRGLARARGRREPSPPLPLHGLARGVGAGGGLLPGARPLPPGRRVLPPGRAARSGRPRPSPAPTRSGRTGAAPSPAGRPSAAAARQAPLLDRLGRFQEAAPALPRGRPGGGGARLRGPPPRIPQGVEGRGRGLGGAGPPRGRRALLGARRRAPPRLAPRRPGGGGGWRLVPGRRSLAGGRRARSRRPLLPGRGRPHPGRPRPGAAPRGRRRLGRRAAVDWRRRPDVGRAPPLPRPRPGSRGPAGPGRRASGSGSARPSGRSTSTPGPGCWLDAARLEPVRPEDRRRTLPPSSAS